MNNKKMEPETQKRLDARKFNRKCNRKIQKNS